VTAWESAVAGAGRIAPAPDSQNVFSRPLMKHPG
jgi:hypothetical protein